MSVIDSICPLESATPETAAPDENSRRRPLTSTERSRKRRERLAARATEPAADSSPIEPTPPRLATVEDFVAARRAKKAREIAEYEAAKARRLAEEALERAQAEAALKAALEINLAALYRYDRFDALANAQFTGRMEFFENLERARRQAEIEERTRQESERRKQAAKRRRDDAAAVNLIELMLRDEEAAARVAAESGREELFWRLYDTTLDPDDEFADLFRDRFAHIIKNTKLELKALDAGEEFSERGLDDEEVDDILKELDALD